MQGLFAQAGWCGVAIAVLAVAAAYAAARGIVLCLLRARRSWLSGPGAAKVVEEVRRAQPEDRQMALAALMRVEFSGIFGASSFLRLCAAAGPLLGLLGTVLGMVDVFASISEGSSVDPALLAGGIWKALSTTVMGLVLAIPAMIASWFMQSRLRRIRTGLMLRSSGIAKG